MHAKLPRPNVNAVLPPKTNSFVFGSVAFRKSALVRHKKSGNQQHACQVVKTRTHARTHIHTRARARTHTHTHSNNNNNNINNNTNNNKNVMLKTNLDINKVRYKYVVGPRSGIITSEKNGDISQKKKICRIDFIVKQERSKYAEEI